MQVFPKRLGPKPDDPVNLLNAQGEVLKGPDDEPITLAENGPDPIPDALAQHPQFKALMSRLESETAARELEARERQREKDERADADRKARVTVLREQSGTFAAGLVTGEKILPAQETAFANAHAVLAITAAGLPLPDDLKPQVALDGFKAAAEELKATGLTVPVLNPDGTLPAGLQLMPSGQSKNVKAEAKQQNDSYYGKAAAS